MEKFTGHIETAYLSFFLKRFSFKVKEQDNSPRKVYAIDAGLANTIGFRFTSNFGPLIENIVFLYLKRKQLNDPSFEVFYWKDELGEVDFVVKQNLKIKELIQVCWDTSNPATRAREIKSLTRAMRDLKLRRGIIITEQESGEKKINGRTIKFIPLVDWLLSLNSKNE
ncbi:ATP-binding protein [archaeon]|nr:ATP-binding protein [archaeon]